MKYEKLCNSQLQYSHSSKAVLGNVIKHHADTNNKTTSVISVKKP